MLTSVVRDNKFIYSDHWLLGYEDSHASQNLSAINAEIGRSRKNFSRSDYAVYYGYRNGLKARVALDKLVCKSKVGVKNNGKKV